MKEWEGTTAPFFYLSPELIATIAASQPRPHPHYKLPIHRFLLSLAISLALFVVPVVGLALLTGR